MKSKRQLLSYYLNKYNRVKNIIIAVLLIIIFVQFNYSFSKISRKSEEITNFNRTLVKEGKRIAALQLELDDLRNKQDAQEAYIKEKGKAGMELIDKLANIDNLSELIDAYQPKMDGAVSEGYGYKTAELTQNEGLKKLIYVLSDKDIEVTSDVSYLLFSEYSIQNNLRVVERMIGELESIDYTKMKDKEKIIVFSLLKEAYSAKNEIKGNL
jgi:hypothetical protein